MNEFLSALLQAVLVAAIPVIATFAGKGLKALATYLGEKSQNDMARKYLDEAAEAISTAVTFTSQTYVDALKKSGKFDKDAQKWAMQVALAQAQRLLTEETKNFLTEAYGDLATYLEGRIEAEVRNQKLSAASLAA